MRILQFIAFMTVWCIGGALEDKVFHIQHGAYFVIYWFFVAMAGFSASDLVGKY